MNRTKIEWADYTWNPVTGCPNGCKYCYAKRIYQRFNKTPYSEVVYHENRLQDPFKLNKPSAIFVGSMSDIFFWKKEWTDAILNVARKCPQHKFLFLTKNAQAYHGIDWPGNCWTGLTLTKLEDAADERWLLDLDLGNTCKKKFLSLEPLQGFVLQPIPKWIDLVICGAMTGPGAQAPDPDWVQSVLENVPGPKLFWKRNMDKYRA